MKSKDTKNQKIQGGQKVQNRNIYTVKEGKSKDTKLRGLKGTNEDISISQETELKGTRQNRVKRYKETPVLKEVLRREIQGLKV